MVCLPRLAYSTKVRGLANGSEGVGWPGPAQGFSSSSSCSSSSGSLVAGCLDLQRAAASRLAAASRSAVRRDGSERRPLGIGLEARPTTSTAARTCGERSVGSHAQSHRECSNFLSESCRWPSAWYVASAAVCGTRSSRCEPSCRWRPTTNTRSIASEICDRAERRRPPPRQMAHCPRISRVQRRVPIRFAATQPPASALPRADVRALVAPPSRELLCCARTARRT